MDAGEAIANLKVVAKAVSPPGFLGITNSDLAFTGNYAIQGNYNGPVIWDISNPAKPELVTAFTCPASQNDVSVYKNLMFMSAEANNGRVDCMPGWRARPVSAQRIRGVRIFDITRHQEPEARRQRADLPRLAHAHGARGSEGQGQRLHLRLRLGAASARRTSWRAACARRRTRTRTRRCSASRSSRCRSPIPTQSAVVSTREHLRRPHEPAAPRPVRGRPRGRRARPPRTRARAGGFTAKIPQSGAGDRARRPAWCSRCCSTAS